MDSETIRTLITAISAVMTTAVVALFGCLSLSRKDRIKELKNKLISTYNQFSMLYKVEEKLLAMLEEAGKGNKNTIKINVRKEISGEADDKIKLTPERIKIKINEIKNY